MKAPHFWNLPAIPKARQTNAERLSLVHANLTCFMGCQKNSPIYWKERLNAPNQRRNEQLLARITTTCSRAISRERGASQSKQRLDLQKRNIWVNPFQNFLEMKKTWKCWIKRNLIVENLCRERPWEIPWTLTVNPYKNHHALWSKLYQEKPKGYPFSLHKQQALPFELHKDEKAHKKTTRDDQ